MNKKAVVLVSGGMDSALCAALAIKDGYVLTTLHLNYGQRTESKELASFHAISDFYHVESRLIIDAGYFKTIGKSSLTDVSIEISKANLSSKEIPTSYVPFRNGNILSIAASWAESIGAEAIYIGAMQLDSSGYPDCRNEFFEAFEHAINIGTKPETNIRIITPLMNFKKIDIVLIGTELGVPFHLTWSCYKESDIACGVCDSCALRLRGFASAGVEDSLKYAVKPDYGNIE